MGLLERLYKDLFTDTTPPIFKLIQDGDIEGLRKYGSFDTKQAYESYPPIMYALQKTKRNSYMVVEFLIGAGCDVNARDSYTAVQYTPLMTAVNNKESSLDMAKLLLKNGANVNARSIAGASALSTTLFTLRLDVLDMLKINHANFNLHDFEGNTIFHQLVSTSLSHYFPNVNEQRILFEQYIKRLVDYGANPKASNKAGLLPTELETWGHRPDNCKAMKKLLSKYI